MMKQSTLKALLVVVAMAVPSAIIAQQNKGHGGGGGDHKPPAPAATHVDFGILPTAPLGPPPCFQGGPAPAPQPGGAGDPCAFKFHVLTPEEASVAKGGEVTFQFHGGGHGMAIYRVDEDTTRDEVGQFLCAGDDPADSHGFTDTHPCPTQGAANAAALHEVKDGDGEVVIVASPNVTNVHPDNRVSSPEGRLVSAGGVQFMNGGTTPAPATGPPNTSPTGGQLVTYRFLKNGRYLVICMNRSHFLNDWMFGFVNVHGGDDN